jgi:hypothetical protein
MGSPLPEDRSPTSWGVKDTIVFLEWS